MVALSEAYFQVYESKALVEAKQAGKKQQGQQQQAQQQQGQQQADGS
jgi:hypothetical protein